MSAGTPGLLAALRAALKLRAPRDTRENWGSPGQALHDSCLVLLVNFAEAGKEFAKDMGRIGVVELVCDLLLAATNGSKREPALQSAAAVARTVRLRSGGEGLRVDVTIHAYSATFAAVVVLLLERHPYPLGLRA